MFSRNTYILAALSGIVGPVVLVASFIINPAPPASDTNAQLRDFALQHRVLDRYRKERPASSGPKIAARWTHRWIFPRWTTINVVREFRAAGG